jgi:hypothetical protein
MQFFDRVQQTTATTGTGAYTLSASAVDGFVAISARYADGAEVPYCCTDDADFEVGIGTYTASENTLSRDTILTSSNSGAEVNWSSGDKKLFVTLPAATINKIPFGDPLFFLDGSMVAGVPVDKIGLFPFSVGSYGLTSEVVSGGSLSGRSAFVSAAKIGSSLTFTGNEELRIINSLTVAAWINLSSTVNGTLWSCNSNGETITTNILYDLQTGTDVFFTSIEHSSGSNSSSNNGQSISGFSGDWLFVVFSRSADGRSVGLSVWNDSDGTWMEDSLLVPYTPAKGASGNTQVFTLMSYSPETAGPGMSCAGMAMWPKYMSLPERRKLKDIFFQLG